MIQNALSRKIRFTAIYKRQSDTWLLWTSQNKKVVSLKALQIKGPNLNDIAGPVILDSWTRKVFPFAASVSSEDDISVFLRDPKNKNSFGKQYDKIQQDKYISKELPLPQGKNIEIRDIQFSSDDILYCVWLSNNFWLDIKGQQELSLGKLNDGKWEIISKVNELKTAGYIFQPKIFFDSQRKPIVVWGNFHPL